MRIRWTPPAAADMQSISDYLKEHKPKYRHPTLRKIYENISEILFPPMPYIAVYRIHGQDIEK